MTDPKRWLDDAGFASSLEHELVLSGKRLTPPEGAASRGWAELAPLLGPEPGPGSSGSSGGSDPSGPSGTGLDTSAGSLSLGSGASALGAGALKAFVIGAALGAGVMGVVQITRAPGPAPASVALATPPVVHAPPNPRSAPAGDATNEPSLPEPPSAASEPVQAALPAPPSARAVAGAAMPGAQRAGVLAVSPAVSAPAPSAELPPSPPPVAAAAPAASASVTPEGDASASAGPAPSGGPGSANWLRAEAQDMARARNLLSSGRAAEALALLQSAADRFGGGALAQEREALIVEALFGSGRTEQARARARAFVQKYPNSPMSERMRKLERGGH